MPVYNYRKGILSMLGSYMIWGFQPLYFNLFADMDTFFVMAGRIIFGAVTCLVILKLQGRVHLLGEALRDRSVIKRELPAMFFLFTDWIVYLWAVQNGRVLECSLGYYILPLVVFFFGAVIFREKITWRHIVILAIVIVGIVLSTSGFGGVPYVTIILAVAFAIYAAIKKSLQLDSIVSTTLEILLMVPIALLYVAFFRMGENGVAGLTLTRFLLMIGSGVLTGIPMVLYAIAVRNLPLMTTGIGQYLSPTLAILCGLIMGESLNPEKLRSFYFIWVGVILYTMNIIYEAKSSKDTK